MREIDYTPELHSELPSLSGNRYFPDNTFLDSVRRETLKIESVLNKYKLSKLMFAFG